MQFLIIIVAILSIPVLAFSDTIIVPDDYPTIQQAIDAAVSGDMVLVDPGIYVERIDFLGKAIYLLGKEGAELTVIDAGGYHRVVTFMNNEGLDSIIEGFTLRNGDANTTSGAGIFCLDSSPTIRHNIITEIIAGSISSVVYCRNGSPVIEHNSIHDNDIGSNINTDGIFCYQSSPTITNNEIYNNPGIGIQCNESTSYIANNHIYNNFGYPATGGGIFCSSSSPVIENNMIRGNSVVGGIVCAYDSSPKIINNFILGNRGEQGAGGIVCQTGSHPTILNCTIMYNEGINCPVGGIHCQSDCFPVVTNTIIWANVYIQAEGNLTITYSDIQDGWPGAGNIDADPLVLDKHGDAHLTFNSPGKDAGDGSAAYLPQFDFEGNPRVAYGTVDMGADEFYTHLYVTGDKTPGGSIQGKFVGLPGTSPVGLFIGSGILPSPMPTMWGEYWLQAPWFLFTLIPIPSNGILELHTTLPGSIPAPYDIPMQALIGLNADSLTNLCVLEVR